MAILGSSIDPRLFLQDYSGFTRAAEMQGQAIAGVGQQIGEALKLRKEEEKNAKKAVTMAKQQAKAISQLLPEMRGAIDEQISALSDPNLSLNDQANVAQGFLQTSGMFIDQARENARMALEREKMASAGGGGGMTANQIMQLQQDAASAQVNLSLLKEQDKRTGGRFANQIAQAESLFKENPVVGSAAINALSQGIGPSIAQPKKQEIEYLPGPGGIGEVAFVYDETLGRRRPLTQEELYGTGLPTRNPNEPVGQNNLDLLPARERFQIPADFEIPASGTRAFDIIESATPQPVPSGASASISALSQVPTAGQGYVFRAQPAGSPEGKQLIDVTSVEGNNIVTKKVLFDKASGTSTQAIGPDGKQIVSITPLTKSAIEQKDAAIKEARKLISDGKLQDAADRLNAMGMREQFLGGPITTENLFDVFPELKSESGKEVKAGGTVENQVAPQFPIRLYKGSQYVDVQNQEELDAASAKDWKQR